MNCRRHKSGISFLIVASVFLCLFTCCGVPSYLVPTYATVSNLSNDPATPESIDIQVIYQSESSVPGSMDRVGLLLLYYLDDNADYSQHSNIISKFKSNYKINDYDGVAAYIRSGKPVIEYSDQDTACQVFAFTESGNVVSAPYYTIQLDNSAPVNLILSLVYDDVHHSVTVFDNINSSVIAELGFDEEGLPSGQYIKVFAAISVQSQNFSNIYWSDLKYVGTVE